MMDEIDDLIKPIWGPQAAIHELWNQINADEKKIICLRMDNLFKEGLPFELKHDKLVYVHMFLFLAQVDIMVCQIPLKFGPQMPTLEFQQRMRAQLLDEIFHVLLSLKIVRLLCVPYMFPPNFNENVARFCQLINEEPCPKIAVILLNLLGECFAEELVNALPYDFAPKVIDIILADERRHVSDAELYNEMGLPDRETMSAKIRYFEEQVFSSLLIQYNHGLALFTVLGKKGVYQFITRLKSKCKEQLKKIHLEPGENWSSFLDIPLQWMKKSGAHLSDMQVSNAIETEMTTHRKRMMTPWRDPADPTMVGQFNIDVSSLDFFNKKYPSETLTILMLQTISHVLERHPEYQLFIKDKKIYQNQKVLVSLVVQLPECEGHLGLVSFENCHKLSVRALSIRIRTAIEMMSYCYKKVEQLEKAHPHLALIQNSLLNEMSDPFYPPMFPPAMGISLSNIGRSGYTQAKSPLLPKEAAKVTMLEVERRPVWSQINNAFEPRDLLPVSVSVDHRVFDGNLPLPKIMNRLFQEAFQRMESRTEKSTKTPVKEALGKAGLLKLVDRLLDTNLDLGYLTLTTLHTMWPDFIRIETLLNSPADALCVD